MDVQRVIGPEHPLSPREAGALPALVLAYIGDAVYELLVRTAALGGGGPVDRLHNRVVEWVSAAGQERVWQAIEKELTPEEAAVARRGRNAKGSVPKGATPSAYRAGTSLEALVGYLYLTGDAERLERLLGPSLRTVGGEGE